MQAAVVTEAGGPEVFALQERPDPVVGPEDVLVDVHATALNRADLLQRRGGYPAPPGVPADIPGLEMAGVVAAVGAHVTAWRPGDRVMALLGGGGYATRVAVHERMLMPVPAALSLEEAAAIPEVFLTAFDALFLQCELQAGESVLLHAVGSGVGTAGTQLARAIGARVFGTAGSADKLERARALGLDVPIAYRDQDFAEVVAAETGGRGVDVILDVVGAPYWVRNLQSLAELGRMVMVGTMGGATVEFNIGLLMRRRLRVHGTMLRSRPLEQKITVTQTFAHRFLPLFERGALQPVVDAVYPLEEVADAHRSMEANENFGKIVLRVRDGDE